MIKQAFSKWTTFNVISPTAKSFRYRFMKTYEYRGIKKLLK